MRYKDGKGGFVNIVFVKSAENNSEILTKNLNAELHEKYSKEMMGEKHEDSSSLELAFCLISHI